MEAIFPKCIRNNNCYLVCNNQHCVNSPFMCKEDECECQQNHKNCFTNVKWKILKQRIKSKLKKPSSNVQKHFEKVEQIYKNTIKQIYKSYEAIKLKYETLGLNQAQQQLFNKLKEKKFHQLDGCLISKIEKQLHQSFMVQVKDAQILALKIKKQTDILLNLLGQLTKQKKLDPNQIISSKIIEDCDSVKEFLKPKLLKAFHLLYRASDNDFRIDKFWQKCHNKKNTLTLVKTQYGKIIGGYTPLAWDKDLNNYISDQNKQTFLFSITQNHKIPLVDGYEKGAIYSGKKYGPNFAGNDLVIYDKANFNLSRGNIGLTYNNGEYEYDRQRSIQKFCGQQKGYSFKILEWQVYEVKYDDGNFTQGKRIDTIL